jgi:hypothetical protein
MVLCTYNRVPVHFQKAIRTGWKSSRLNSQINAEKIEDLDDGPWNACDVLKGPSSIR